MTSSHPTGRPVGRPASPTEVRRMRGNPSHRPLPPPPAPGAAMVRRDRPPTPVAPLGRLGRRIYRDLWRSASWLGPSDAFVLWLLADALDRKATLLAAVAADGPVVPSPTNGTIAHPALKAIAGLDVQVTAWLSMLGLTPSDRARLGLTEVRTFDALDALAARRAERGAERRFPLYAVVEATEAPPAT